MIIYSKLLLILEVMWEETETGGLCAHSLDECFRSKMGDVQSEFPFSERIATLNSLVRQGLLSKSANVQRLRLESEKSYCSPAFKEHRNANLHEGWDDDFFIAAKGIETLLVDSGADMSRYFEVHELSSYGDGRCRQLMVTAAESARLEEVVAVYSGLRGYYGRVSKISPVQELHDWTSKRKIYLSRAYRRMLTFSSTISNDDLDISVIRLAHQSLFRNQWWRNIGFNWDECLDVITSLKTKKVQRAGERYWGEGYDELEKLETTNVTTITLEDQQLATRFSTKQGTLLFSEFPWETASTEIRDENNTITIRHKMTGECLVMLGNCHVGYVSAPGRFSISVEDGKLCLG